MSVSSLGDSRSVQSISDMSEFGSVLSLAVKEVGYMGILSSAFTFLNMEKHDLLIKTITSLSVGGGIVGFVALGTFFSRKYFPESQKKELGKPQIQEEKREKKIKKVTFDLTKNKEYEISKVEVEGTLPSKSTQEKIKDLTLKDFQLVNTWTHKDGSVVDETTGRSYLNDSPLTVRFKSFALCAGTPFVHLVAGILNIAYRIAKLVSGFHFWKTVAGEQKYDLEGRIKDFRIDLLKMVANPFALITLELAAFYGIFMPYDGRKLYASIERAVYGNPILAPCFQPDACKHLFGGDINTPNAW